jgi:RNA polymerase-interacting CarD/CdnL/TRCF family regulator
VTSARGDDSIVELLEELRAIVAGAKGVPLSASVLVPRDQTLALIARCLASSPREVVEAREVLLERTQVLERTQAEVDQLLSEAHRQMEAMVAEGEIVRAAHAGASHIRNQANEQASQLKRQTEDYIDRRLANFEIILSDLLDQTRRGRQRLAESSEPKPVAPEHPDDFFQSQRTRPTSPTRDGGDATDA